MSIKTWKAEFYPKKPTKKMSWAEAIEHSIRKWEGLQKENLEKHQVVPDFFNKELVNVGGGRAGFGIDSVSCALCVKSTEKIHEDVYSINCKLCPIFKKTGKECDYYGKSPWSAWADTKNPKPMLKLLKSLRGVEWDSVMEKRNTET